MEWGLISIETSMDVRQEKGKLDVLDDRGEEIRDFEPIEMNTYVEPCEGPLCVTRSGEEITRFWAGVTPWANKAESLINSRLGILSFPVKLCDAEIPLVIVVTDCVTKGVLEIKWLLWWRKKGKMTLKLPKFKLLWKLMHQPIQWSGHWFVVSENIQLYNV